MSFQGAPDSQPNPYFVHLQEETVQSHFSFPGGTDLNCQKTSRAFSASAPLELGTTRCLGRAGSRRQQPGTQGGSHSWAPKGATGQVASPSSPPGPLKQVLLLQGWQPPGTPGHSSSTTLQPRRTKSLQRKRGKSAWAVWPMDEGGWAHPARGSLGHRAYPQHTDCQGHRSGGAGRFTESWRCPSRWKWSVWRKG